MNVWCGLHGNNLIGHFVFDNNITGNTYEVFLRNELQGLLEDIPLMIWSQMYFQHDGASPHYTRRVREYVTSLFLTAGNVIVDPLHGHRGRQILHLLIITSGAI